MQTIVLIRGIPGTGGSELAKKKVKMDNKAKHYETEMFFIDGECDYRAYQDANLKCQEYVKKALVDGAERVYVSNSFIKEWEAGPYINIAISNKANVEVIELTEIVEKDEKFSEETIKNMLDRWEPAESWKSRSLITIIK